MNFELIKEQTATGGKLDRLPSLEESSICSDTSSVVAALTKEEEAEVAADKSLAAKLNVLHSDSSGPRPMVVGHRGSLFQDVENTLESFRTAIAQGCDAFELDVFLLKCGTLIVFHGDGDDTNPGMLHGYCGVEGSILDYTAEEARRLLKFSSKSKELGHLSAAKLNHATIATLEEVLLLIKGTKTIVKIELKGEGVEVPVLRMIERMDMAHQCHMASFNVARVTNLSKHCPDRHPYCIGVLFGERPPPNFIEVASEAGASEVHLRYDTCTTDRIAAIHAAGMTSMAWFRGAPSMKEDSESKYLDVGNEDESMYRTVLKSGVMSMCVNRPDVLIRAIAG